MRLHDAIDALPSNNGVLIRDVGPRDGLQALGQDVPLSVKQQLVADLAAAGVPRIEAGSFVSPKAVPRMADSAAVFAAMSDAVVREALVVNERGAHQAVAADVDVLVGVVSASETFSQKNVRMSTDEAVAELAKIIAVAAAAGRPVSVDLSASFGCAFEGPMPVDEVASVAAAIAHAGADEIVLADTIGAAAPNDIVEVIGAVRARVGNIALGLHLHDTRGLALANAAAGLEAGVRRFDASAGGLGGCPFSPGATGNVCTEDLVHLFHALGAETGIDLESLIGAARRVEESLGFDLPSRMLRAGPRFTRLAS